MGRREWKIFFATMTLMKKRTIIYLNRESRSLFMLCLCVFFVYFSCLFCVVGTSASDCLERLVSKMTY